jgi:hypothetical protein
VALEVYVALREMGATTGGDAAKVEAMETEIAEIDAILDG